MMKCVTAKLLLVTLLAASVLAEEEQELAVELDKKITKLQIGVKKRVPAAECTKKSRNGSFWIIISQDSFCCVQEIQCTCTTRARCSQTDQSSTVA